MTGKAFPYVALGVLMAATTAQASSPDEWEKYHKEVSAKCMKACGLKAARVLGDIVLFDDERVGLDAVLITGRYPQPQMNNAQGHALCLFNKKTRKAECSEANEWFEKGNR